MQTLLIILIVLAAIATLVALVRGIVIFLKTTESDLKQGGTGVSVAGQRQNKMMMARVGFQALAIVLIALFLLLSR